MAEVANPGQGKSPGTAVRYEEEIVLALLRSADCLHRTMQQLLKPYGITATQYNVLKILKAAPAAGLTCSAVGRMMITHEPDVTRLLGRLKTQKLVRQYRDPDDQRIVRTQIRDMGSEVLNNLEGQVERLNRELLEGLNGGEKAQLAGLLRKARLCQAAVDGVQKLTADPRAEARESVNRVAEVGESRGDSGLEPHAGTAHSAKAAPVTGGLPSIHLPNLRRSQRSALPRRHPE